MKMQELLQQCEGYRLTCAAYDEALLNAKQITEAVKGRLTAERGADAARMAKLQDIIDSESRGETARRMAGVELERLRNRTYVVLPEERALFDEAITNAEQATMEAQALQQALRENFEIVTKELKQLRQDTLGDQGSELRPRWIDGCLKDFEQLGGIST